MNGIANGKTLRWTIGITITLLVLFASIITASVTAQNNIEHLKNKDTEIIDDLDQLEVRTSALENQASRADERQKAIMKSLDEIKDYMRTPR